MRWLIALLCIPAFGAVSLVQSAKGTAGTGGSNPLAVSASFSATPTVGNHVIYTCLSAGNAGAPTVTDNQSGNTYANDQGTADAGNEFNVYTGSAKVVGASGTFTVTCTFNSFTQYAALMVSEFSGLASTNWFDVGAGAYGNTASPHSSGNTATTAQADELLIGSILMACTSCTITEGTSYTKVDEQNWGATGNRKMAQQYRVVSSSAAYAATFSDSQGFGNWVIAIATYKAAAAAPAGRVRHMVIQ